MNIQVINFETCKDHYQVTRMLKTTSHNQIEYTPAYCFKKKEADCYLLISKSEESQLLDWCKENNISSDKVIVLCNKFLNEMCSWTGINIFERDVDFEKICQWLMAVKEKSPQISLFHNCTMKVGKIRKDHDYEGCVQSIMKQNPGLKDAEIFLFVKEKSPFEIVPSKTSRIQLNQYYLKGISDTYDYLIVTKNKKEEII